MKKIFDFFLTRENTMSKSQSLTVLIYRIFAALLIIPFGWGKLNDYDALSKDFFGNVIGIGDEISLILALIVQLGCPILLILGFQSRFISAILALHMVVATKFHFYDPFDKFCYPLAFLGMYCILLALGPGRYSLDYMFYARQKTVVNIDEIQAIIITVVSMVLGWIVFYFQFQALISVLLLLIIFSMWAYSFSLVRKKI